MGGLFGFGDDGDELENEGLEAVDRIEDTDATMHLREEELDVSKHRVQTGEVALHKRAVEETERVTETVRKEGAHVDVDGDANVVNNAGTDDDLRV